MVVFLTDGQRLEIEVVCLPFGDAKLSGNLLVLKFGIELFDHDDIRLGLSFYCFLCVPSTIEKTTVTNKRVKKHMLASGIGTQKNDTGFLTLDHKSNNWYKNLVS